MAVRPSGLQKPTTHDGVGRRGEYSKALGVVPGGGGGPSLGRPEPLFWGVIGGPSVEGGGRRNIVSFIS